MVYHESDQCLTYQEFILRLVLSKFSKYIHPTAGEFFHQRNDGISVISIGRKLLITWGHVGRMSIYCLYIILTFYNAVTSDIPILLSRLHIYNILIIIS